MDFDYVAIDTRFTDKVNFTEYCWLWVASVDTAGYGLYRYHQRLVKAHILAWYYYTGSWPTEKILHHCDTRPCIRYDHLYEGTSKQNAEDREKRGRSNRRRGSNHGMSKLTECEVTEIVELHKRGMKNASIARLYGLSPSTTSRILRGETWSHATPNPFS